VPLDEKESARRASREMRAAALVITLCFVFVLVAVVLIVLIGHIQIH
jgi:hypothetical protein